MNNTLEISPMESYSNLNEEDTSTCPLLTHEAPKASNDDVQEDPEDENKRVDSDSSEQNSNSSNSTDDDDSLPLNMDDEEIETVTKEPIIQLIHVPNNCDNYYFATWNWPLIRKLCSWTFFAILCGSIGIVIGIICTLPNSCNPPILWYQHPIVSVRHQNDLREVIDHLRSLNIQQVELSLDLDRSEFWKNNFSTLFINGPYMENNNNEKVAIERHLRDTNNVIEVELVDIRYLESIFNLIKSYQNSPWILWSINQPDSISLSFLQLMLPGIPKLEYKSTKDEIVQHVLEIRRQSPALYLNAVLKNEQKKYNIEFLDKIHDDIIIFKRWYPRKQSLAFAMNLGKKDVRIDFSKIFYFADIIALSSSNSTVSVNDLILKPTESVILAIE